MEQLDLFPQRKLNSLSDFLMLESLKLSNHELRKIVVSPQFFQITRANDVIKREHAKVVDKILGFRVKYIEEMLLAEARGFDPEGTHETWGPKLHQGIQTWVGLDQDTLQTPYAECLKILQLLKLRPYQHVVDLGAGYGRLGVVIGCLYPKNFFTGYEFVKARVDEGNRIYIEYGLISSQLIQQDLSHQKFTLPEADVYFIYDYGEVEHIERNLNQIKIISYKRPILLVSRGRFSQKIIENNHPWLKIKYEFRYEVPISIYSAFG